jgi:hypothetical protein
VDDVETQNVDQQGNNVELSGNEEAADAEVELDNGQCKTSKRNGEEVNKQDADQQASGETGDDEE